MSDEGTKIVGEGGPVSLSPQAHEEAVAVKAREKGWRPLDEWQGDPDDWVDSKEFVGRQKLYDRINDLKGTLTKQAKEFQSDMRAVASSLTKVRETEYKKALAALTRQREEAIENYDARSAVQVTEEIKVLEAEKAAELKEVQQAATNSGPTPEFVAWQEKNAWFNSDSDMREDALHIGTGYLHGNPNKSQAEVLDYVTKKIQRMYPEKFQTKEKRMAAAPVEGNSPSARQTEVNTRKGKLSLSDLAPEHQVIAKTLIKRGAFKAAAEKNKRSEVDEYMAQYQENA